MEKKLKKAYLDEGKRDQILAEIEKDRQRLNACVSELKEGSGISIDDVEALKAISVEWCRNYVKEAEAGYLKNLSPFVVKTVQSDVHERFRASYDKAAPLCSEIHSILNRRKFNIKVDSKGHFWFDEKETKPMAAEAATIHYSDDEIEFCDKVAEIIDKINDFEKWAELKGFEPFFTEQRSTIWNGGTVTHNVVSILTDKEITSIGGVNTKNHLTFNAEVFRDLMRNGYINQNR
jgi:hypothetical protein